MSYSVLDEIQVQDEPPKKVNPRHSGKPHSREAKRKISAAQKARYEQLRKAAQSSLTEERMRIIIRETLDEYLSKNATPVINNNRANIPL